MVRVTPIRQYVEQYPDDVEVVRTTFEEEYNIANQLWHCTFRRHIRYRGQEMPIHYFVVRGEPILELSGAGAPPEAEVARMTGQERASIFDFHHEQAEAAWLLMVQDRDGLEREWQQTNEERLWDVPERVADAARQAERGRIENLLREWDAVPALREWDVVGEPGLQQVNGRKEEIDDYTVYW